MGYRVELVLQKKIEENIQNFRNELNLPLRAITPELVKKIINYYNGTLIDHPKFISQNSLLKIKDNKTGYIFNQTWVQLKHGYWYPNSRIGKNITTLYKFNLDPKEFKICSLCNTPKHKSEFFHSHGRKLGVVDNCKPCFKLLKTNYVNKNPKARKKRLEYEIKYNKDNREKILKNNVKHYTNNKEKIMLRSWVFELKKVYNITPDQFYEMVKKQNNKCAICERDFGLNSVMKSGKIKKPAIDHDHKTGKIRKLLCHYCNCGLGSFNDSIDNLNKAIQYLKDN